MEHGLVGSKAEAMLFVVVCAAYAFALRALNARAGPARPVGEGGCAQRWLGRRGRGVRLSVEGRQPVGETLLCNRGQAGRTAKLLKDLRIP